MRAVETPSQTRAWLQSKPSSLPELRERFAAEWLTVEHELRNLAEQGPDSVVAYVAGLTAPLPDVGRVTAEQDRLLLSLQVQRLMAAAALRQASFAAATGVSSGRVRFNLVNGYLAQKLFFARGLERKPVALVWFRLLWPLLAQKRLLMPLVQQQGIYCFFSRNLIRELTARIGDRRCLEIGAGDGTLSRFLAAEGVAITATDNYSWRHEIRYPGSVLREDARTALRRHRPEVVICCWPPAANTFEQHVFTAPSVRCYIAINGGEAFVSGNRSSYLEQRGFAHTEDRALGRMVLPPELDAVVHIFERDPD